MKEWFMLTLVGKDRPGIVAQLSAVLYQGDCNLGEASMARLGGNFSIMLMVEFEGTVDQLEQMVDPVCASMDLRFHADKIEGQLHQHVEPDVRISVYGADRPGIVAEVTGALAKAGLNILNLETDVGGDPDKAIYVIHFEGVATQGIDILQKALDGVVREKSVDAQLTPIDTLLG